MKAVCYFRVSSAAQAEDDRQSLPAQHEDAAAWCAEHGLEVVGTFEDVESGTHVRRDDYQRMVARIRAGGVEVVVMREWARFGRNMIEAIARGLEVMGAGLAIHEFGPRAIRTAEHPEFIWQVVADSYSAQKQSDETRRNARRGQRRAMAQGTFIGLPSYGYRKAGTTVAVYEPEARTVRMCFAWYAHENRSLLWIASRLNTLRIPTRRGKAWESAQIHRMLRNECYAGVYRWGADTLAIPPVIDRDLWAVVQARCDRKRELPFGKTQSSGYLLSGLVTCGVCAGGMVGFTPAVGEGRRGYRCNRARTRACPNRAAVRADDLEAAVIAAVEDRRGSIHAVRTASVMEVAEAETALRRLQDERAAVLRRRDEMLRAMLRGADVIAALAEEEVAALNRAVADAERLAQQARARSEAAAEVAQRWRSFTEALAQDRGAAKALLQSLVRRVTVTPGGDPVVEIA